MPLYLRYDPDFSRRVVYFRLPTSESIIEEMKRQGLR